MNQKDIIRYFDQKYQELLAEYGFTINIHSPCHIETTEDIIYYVNDLAKNLFEEEDYHFIEHPDSTDSVLFNYKGENIELKIDNNFKHIEPDYYQKIKLMATLSNMSLAHVNQGGPNVAGSAKDMRAAWYKGFPIHIPEVNFRHRHITGKFFKKEEVGSMFIVEGTITRQDFENQLLLGLNDFLEKRSYDIRYSSNQIKAYQEEKNTIGAYMNGDYSMSFKIEDGKMKIVNGFEPQIFLSTYLDLNLGTKVFFKRKNGALEEVVGSFNNFIATLGKDK